MRRWCRSNLTAFMVRWRVTVVNALSSPNVHLADHESQDLTRRILLSGMVCIVACCSIVCCTLHAGLVF